MLKLMGQNQTQVWNGNDNMMVQRIIQQTLGIPPEMSNLFIYMLNGSRMIRPGGTIKENKIRSGDNILLIPKGPGGMRKEMETNNQNHQFWMGVLSDEMSRLSISDPNEEVKVSETTEWA